MGSRASPGHIIPGCSASSAGREPGVLALPQYRGVPGRWLRALSGSLFMLVARSAPRAWQLRLVVPLPVPLALLSPDHARWLAVEALLKLQRDRRLMQGTDAGHRPEPAGSLAQPFPSFRGP